uniref:Cystatin domain-containing protein n=1 Tax=Steinernema glaseri TaxID=37863 RepID=A0A1I8ACP6_9BILA
MITSPLLFFVLLFIPIFGESDSGSSWVMGDGSSWVMDGGQSSSDDDNAAFLIQPPPIMSYSADEIGNDPEILVAAKAALRKEGKSTTGLKIVSATSQILGSRYTIKFKYAEGGNAVHEMTVNDSPWNNKLTVEEFN